MANITRNYEACGGSTWHVGGDLVVDTSGRMRGLKVVELTTADSTGTALETSSFLVVNSSGIPGNTYTVNLPRAGEALVLYQNVSSTAAVVFNMQTDVASTGTVFSSTTNYLTGTTGSGGLAILRAYSSGQWFAEKVAGWSVTTG